MYVWPEKQDQNQMKMKPFDQPTTVGFPEGRVGQGLRKSAPVRVCPSRTQRRRGNATSKSIGTKLSTERCSVTAILNIYH